MTTIATPAVHTLTVTRTVPEQTLRDLLITACEGGINYWAFRLTGRAAYQRDTDPYASVARRSDSMRPMYGYMLPCHSDVHRIDTATLMRGMQLAASSRYAAVAARVLDGQEDADDADVIVQLGVFGRVVFG